ncbi:hypothetical protein ASF25_17500 [Methylobacterium sp. Leaf100]|nr:hypothetical protein ASF25_17500 [Methylobacterium sp. Leaf100]
MRTEADGGTPRIEVLSKGPRTSRPPLLFVHGTWHAAWCWDEGFLDRLAAQGWEVHAMSLRGHGGSEGHDRLRWTRVRDFVDDIASVVRTLARPPILVGHSMGGFLVQKFLENGKAAGAVLLAPMPHYGVASTTLRLLRQDPVGVLRANATFSLTAMISTPAKARRLFFSASMPDADVERHFGRLQDDAFLAYVDLMALDLCKPSRVTVPILVLGAGDDAIFTRRQVEAVAAAYRTTAEFFPGMAHDMMLERGWEAVADRIAEWVGPLPSKKSSDHVQAL